MPRNVLVACGWPSWGRINLGSWQAGNLDRNYHHDAISKTAIETLG